MFEKERFDDKLFILRLIKKIWVVLGAAVLGAVIVALIYYTDRGVIRAANKYETISRFDITYDTDPITENEYTYINSATWDIWVKSDAFIEELKKTGLNDSELKLIPDGISAKLETDLRMVEVTVVASDKDTSKSLCEKTGEVFERFFTDKQEIKEVKLIDITDTVMEPNTPRIPQSLILGAILGILVSLSGIVLKMFWDEGVYVPLTFTERFKIPARFVIFNDNIGYDEINKKELQKLFKETCAEESAKKITVLDLNGVDRESLTKYFAQIANDATVNIVPYSDLSKDNSVVIAALKAGKVRSSHVWEILKLAESDNIVIKATVLCDVDKKLYRAYYRRQV
ncbi:MAG: hypothetical protein K6F84_07770 [Lachnospiraceae bacterium]|nr:hypothetical protein [Lachnospiraceae bacterium]